MQSFNAGSVDRPRSAPTLSERRSQDASTIQPDSSKSSGHRGATAAAAPGGDAEGPGTYRGGFLGGHRLRHRLLHLGGGPDAPARCPYLRPGHLRHHAGGPGGAAPPSGRPACEGIAHRRAYPAPGEGSRHLRPSGECPPRGGGSRRLPSGGGADPKTRRKIRPGGVAEGPHGGGASPGPSCGGGGDCCMDEEPGVSSASSDLLQSAL